MRIMLESAALRSGGGVVCRHDNIIPHYRCRLSDFSLWYETEKVESKNMEHQSYFWKVTLTGS